MSMRVFQISECSFRSRVLHRPSLRISNFGRSFIGTPLRIRKLAVSSSCPPRVRRQVTRMGLFGLGVPELIVIAGVAALLFGPSKLPELGKGLGKTMKSVQSAAKEFETELKKEMETEDQEEEEESKTSSKPPEEPTAPVTSSTEKET